MKRVNNRDYLFDVLRIVAIWGVVCLHISAPVVKRAPSINSLNWWIGNVANSYSRWSVPIFVMISGALILNNKYKSIASFYQKRARRILVPILFWSIFYFVWEFIQGIQLSAYQIVISIAMGVPYYHLWFLYMILGLYLITPFLSAFVKITDRKLLIFFIAIFYTFVLMQSCTDKIYGKNISVFTTYSIYFIPYFLMGFSLFRTELKIFNDKKPLFWVGMFLLSGLAIALITGLLLPYLGEKTWGLMYNNFNPLVVIMSISLALLVKSLFAEINYRYTRFLERLSSLTLGIYVIHPFWIDVLNLAGFSTLSITPLISIPVMSLTIFILSALSAYLLYLVPGLRRVI